MCLYDCLVESPEKAGFFVQVYTKQIRHSLTSVFMSESYKSYVGRSSTPLCFYSASNRELRANYKLPVSSICERVCVRHAVWIRAEKNESKYLTTRYLSSKPDVVVFSSHKQPKKICIFCIVFRAINLTSSLKNFLLEHSSWCRKWTWCLKARWVSLVHRGFLLEE